MYILSDIIIASSRENHGSSNLS